MANPKSLGVLGGVAEEVNFVIASVRSRGLKHYFRAVALGVLSIVAAQKIIFVSGQEKLQEVKFELDAASAKAQHADTYRALEDNLRTFSARLPPQEDSSTWFLNTVIDSLKAEGLVALSISPVQQMEGPNFKYLSMTLTFKSKFSQAAQWVARVEGSKKLMHVSSLSIIKDPEKIGNNNVSAIVASLIPKGGM